jgi:hypothetical protein
MEESIINYEDGLALFLTERNIVWQPVESLPSETHTFRVQAEITPQLYREFTDWRVWNGFLTQDQYLETIKNKTNFNHEGL